MIFRGIALGKLLFGHLAEYPHEVAAQEFADALLGVASPEHGIGDQDLMMLMGWRSFSMAARYTRSGEGERALRAHRQYSPADNLPVGS